MDTDKIYSVEAKRTISTSKQNQNADQRLASLQHSLRTQAEDERMDNFVSFIYTAEMISNFVDKELSKIGLNRTQMGILCTVVLCGGTITPTELSVNILRSKHATSRALDSLEKPGYISSEKTELKSRIKADRRLRNVSITAKGLEVVEKSMPVNMKMAVSIMDCLKNKEAGAFKNTLSRLRQQMFTLENPGDSKPDLTPTVIPPVVLKYKKP
jgi:DNA-binding MarR family transcriptional regulator